MSNDIVRYNNGLNSVPLRRFSPVDMDLFWGICSKMKRKGLKQETFTFSNIRELINYDETKGMSRFGSDLVDMSKKLITLSFVYEDESIYEQLNLFQKFSIDKNKQTLSVKTSDEFEYILNSIGSNFTRLELANMTRITSTYSKEMYRQLMSHRDRKTGSGAWFVKREEFEKLMGIPKSFRMSDIDKRVFEQAKKDFLTSDEEGTSIFESFSYEKVKGKKGNKISSFRIYFKEPSALPPELSEGWDDPKSAEIEELRRQELEIKERLRRLNENIK